MNHPLPSALAPCPNPECISPVKLRIFHALKSEISIGDRYQVIHDYCGYRGPLGDTPEDATRLHNLICRPSATASPEPVAWRYVHLSGVLKPFVTDHRRQDLVDESWGEEPLYSRPESSRGPVMWWIKYESDIDEDVIVSTKPEGISGCQIIPLYTHPSPDAPREEVREIADKVANEIDEACLETGAFFDRELAAELIAQAFSVNQGAEAAAAEIQKWIYRNDGITDWDEETEEFSPSKDRAEIAAILRQHSGWRSQ